MDKDYLKQKIIPALFYNNDGKKLLREAEEYFKNQNLSINTILSRYESCSNLQDITFWKDMGKCVSLIFQSELSLPSSFSDEEDFNKYVNLLMKIKFDFVFDPFISQKIENSEKVEEFLSEFIGENTLEIESEDKIRRIIHPLEREFRFNLKPNQSSKVKLYPNLLIKIDGNKISFESSQKKRIKGIITNIENKRENDFQKILSEINCEELNNFKINHKTFLMDLRDEDFYIKNIKFSNTLLYFIFGFRKNGNFDHLLNSGYYINSPLDFLAIKELKLEYLFENGKRNAEVKIERIIQDINSNIKSVKYLIRLSREKTLPSEIKQEILGKLKKLGFENDVSYNLPIEYYFNKIFSRILDKKSSIKKIQSIEENNLLLKKIIEKKVINSEYNFSREKFEKFLIETISLIKNKKIVDSEGNFLEILDIFHDENKNMILKIKMGNDNINFNEIHNVFIDVKKISGQEKILYLFIEDLDYGFILSKILKGEENKALDFIFGRIKGQIIYEYSEILEKHANSCHKYLENYVKNFKIMEKETKPHILGMKVEDKLNVILKYLFRNYLALGGSNKPDGILPKDNELNVYLIDSKSHRKIDQIEVNKMASYLLNYSNLNSYESKKGILIVCKGKLKNSLNKKARDLWKQSKEYREENFSISFISLEFILELFSLYKSQRINSYPKLRKEFIDKIFYLADLSKDYNEVKELEKIEKEIIEGLKSKINEVIYLPQTRNSQM